MWYPSTGPVAQRITRLTTDQKIAGSNPAWVKLLFRHFLFCAKGYLPGSKAKEGGNWPSQQDGRGEREKKKVAPPGGLEPPTFRLTAERASLLRHGGLAETAQSESRP